MKLYKLSLVALATLGLVACDDINDVKPEGDGLSAAQTVEAVELIPERTDADFSGIFSMMGQPIYYSPRAERDDDFGFIMSAISQDAEGPDLQFPNSGYNWFAPCGELTSRDVSYANPLIRYATPYTQIKLANDLMANYITSEDQLDDEAFLETLSEKIVNQIAQAKAVRAFDYLTLAPEFQFSYAAGAQDEPCVPIVKLGLADASNNPRATVKEVYDLAIEDLTWAIAHLDESRATKAYINLNVAYGLRARAYLATEQWALAAADAEKAAEGYTPASINEVSVPSFYNINDHNWMWGYDMTESLAQLNLYATSCSWIGSFSKKSYACGAGCYAFINRLLFDKIPDTDVRKGWWLDAQLYSPLLEGLDWEGVRGTDIVSLKITDVKAPYIAYTNLKFGAPNIPTSTNDADWPFMRVEEMILIQAEGYAKSGNEAKAKDILTNFVQTYRDPSYKVPASTTRSLADEIWFQRRVELWGEGFSWADMMRLNKPLVRFHDDNSNYPDLYKFNLPAKDPWMLMRFPQNELNTNMGIVNNTGGGAPVTGQNPSLRDGVTD